MSKSGIVMAPGSGTITEQRFYTSAWMENPTITVVETLAHPIDEISFPAVTICPQSFNSDRWGSTIKILDFLPHTCPLHG